MIDAYIELLVMFVQSGLMDYGLYTLLWLAFIATVPYIIHALLFQKGGNI